MGLAELVAGSPVKSPGFDKTQIRHESRDHSDEPENGVTRLGMAHRLLIARRFPVRYSTLEESTRSRNLSPETGYW